MSLVPSWDVEVASTITLPMANVAQIMLAGGSPLSPIAFFSSFYLFIFSFCVYSTVAGCDIVLSRNITFLRECKSKGVAKKECNAHVICIFFLQEGHFTFRMELTERNILRYF